MTVTAEAVKVLRERTGAGMMECKKALVETNGDLDAAAELMRKSGLAKADKKASRIAAEGVVAIERSGDGRRAVVVEVNCETDFVAREKDFQQFAAGVAKAALAKRPAERYQSGVALCAALAEAAGLPFTADLGALDDVAASPENEYSASDDHYISHRPSRTRPQWQITVALVVMGLALLFLALLVTH